MAVNLVFISKSGRRKNISLDNGVTVVGRRPDCDIQIPLLYVSRKHCRFICKQDKTVLQDLGSANGTFINSKRIMEAEVNPGDQIGIGSVKFTIQTDGISPEPEVDKATVPPSNSSYSHEEALSDFDIDEILGEENQN